ncbi:MAG: aconitate hydratase, partial [Actinomycetota bacterium]
RATIGNMSPEFGSTVAIFPIDEVTIDYLRTTGRSQEELDLVEAYTKAQGLWLDASIEPRYSEYLELDLSTVVPSIAGPKRPQDRIVLSKSKEAFKNVLPTYTDSASKPTAVRGADFALDNGHVAIASITSCTNTSNPSVMLAAGLLARNAVKRGLKAKPWVKTSLAPGSKVVTDYYEKAGLTADLDALGFQLVGYGCATCIGNSGPLSDEISEAINNNDLAVTAVLSGNRNFEGRISPDVKMNYLASPPLVIAYALAGTMNFDFEAEALGEDQHGSPVFLKDIWPSAEDVQETIDRSISSDMFKSRYASVFEGDDRWKSLPTPKGAVFEWDESSTYVRKAPYFDGMAKTPSPVSDITGARVLAKLGDSVTTDHISPAGSIKVDSPAGKYLTDHGISRSDFNSYGSRRGNHEVMIRGTFANIRLKNQLLDGVEGGYTRDFTLADGDQSFIYDASRNYIEAGIPLVILGGKEYGSGSSRDWAAKGTSLLGVKAVITESFERIHRSNLIGMGVLPLQFPAGESADSLGLDGTESFSISGIEKLNEGETPKTVRVVASPTSHSKPGAKTVEFDAVVRIDTPGEADYYRNGGILQYVLRSLVA